MSDAKSVQLVIRGRVQGVFYRAWTKKQAERHGVSGWVRNRPNGSVEALLSGSNAAVEALIAECREGPPSARVESIDVSPAEPVTRRGFEVVD